MHDAIIIVVVWIWAWTLINFSFLMIYLSTTSVTTLMSCLFVSDIKTDKGYFFVKIYHFVHNLILSVRLFLVMNPNGNFNGMQLRDCHQVKLIPVNPS